MLILRAIHTEHKGKYYSGFDRNGFDIIWTTEIDLAERLNSRDASGIVIATIDKMLIAVSPERLPDTTDEECDKFVNYALSGMFQDPSDSLKLLIRQAIRNSPHDTMNEPPDISKTNNEYMSVWEWVARMLAQKDTIQ